MNTDLTGSWQDTITVVFDDSANIVTETYKKVTHICDSTGSSTMELFTRSIHITAGRARVYIEESDGHRALIIKPLSFKASLIKDSVKQRIEMGYGVPQSAADTVIGVIHNSKPENEEDVEAGITAVEEWAEAMITALTRYKNAFFPKENNGGI